MSYEHMDHADWVEAQNSANNHLYGKRRGYRRLPERLTPFQARVMDIMGMVYGGIYNAPISWEKTEYAGPRGVFFTVRDDHMSTFDFARMTRLVFLCHEARIRAEIRAKTKGYFEIMFWERSATGSLSERHPNVAEAVTDFYEYLPANHRIVYRKGQTQAEDLAAEAAE